MTKDLTIRALCADDWQIFRKVRLNALAETPHVYGRSWATENDFDEARWRDILTGDKQSIFGLFDGKNLIGLNSVFTHDEDPSGKTALLAMWYLHKDYRGQGLFHDLVMAGVDWAKKQSFFDTIIVGHREGNEASRRANQRAGFIFTHKILHLFGDGTEGFNYVYEMRLR